MTQIQNIIQGQRSSKILLSATQFNTHDTVILNRIQAQRIFIYFIARDANKTWELKNIMYNTRAAQFIDLFSANKAARSLQSF